MRAELMGCPVDILTMTETIERARDAMRNRKNTQHVALNVAKLVNLRSDPVLAADVANSDLIGIDGMGIVVAARLLGLRVPERVAGIDLFLNLIGLCAAEGYRPYLLGGTEEVVQGTAARLATKHPALSFAGVRNGYFSASEEADIVAAIVESRADCLFIGMPTPRKERFLAAHKDKMRIPFIMGVGGSFDVVAGKVTRAPAKLQSSGFEWLYRVYQEPRRMWWRYARTNSLFALLMMRELVAKRLLRDRLGLSMSK